MKVVYFLPNLELLRNARVFPVLGAGIPVLRKLSRCRGVIEGQIKSETRSRCYETDVIKN